LRKAGAQDVPLTQVAAKIREDNVYGSEAEDALPILEPLNP
jgi:hypothetical protein